MRLLTLALLALTTTACTSIDSLRTPLSSKPVEPAGMEAALLATLNSAVVLDVNDRPSGIVTPLDGNIDDYLKAGYALTDIYCDRFFRNASNARQRRAFSRTLFNDVGATVSAALGIAGASSNSVAGVATATGLSDSLWQNYDRNFVVSPDLGQVRLLVLSAQDEFRRQNITPTDLYTAQSMIVRYAGLCSFLGMQGLMTDSLSRERRRIENNRGEAGRENNRGEADRVDNNEPLGANDRENNVPVAGQIENAEGDPDPR